MNKLLLWTLGIPFWIIIYACFYTITGNFPISGGVVVAGVTYMVMDIKEDKESA